MTQDYGVRILVAYENKRVGQVIFPSGILRQRLVQGGLAEPVQAPPSIVDRSIAAVSKIGRGRRKDS